MNHPSPLLTKRQRVLRIAAVVASVIVIEFFLLVFAMGLGMGRENRCYDGVPSSDWQCSGFTEHVLMNLWAMWGFVVALLLVWYSASGKRPRFLARVDDNDATGMR